MGYAIYPVDHVSDQVGLSSQYPSLANQIFINVQEYYNYLLSSVAYVLPLIVEVIYPNAIDVNDNGR